MATLTVKQDGSGDYTTIQAALNAANTSDIIEIQDSETYNEGELKRIKASLTLRAAAGQTPIIDGEDSKPTGVEFYNNWVVEGLTIRNFTGTGHNGAGLIAVAGNRTVTINNCTVHSCDGDGISTLGVNSVVKNCTVFDIRGGRGIDAGVVQDITIKNCLVYDTFRDGIFASNNGVVIEHCTIYNSNTDPAVAGYGIIATNGAVKYCIVVNPEREDGSHKTLVAGIRSTTSHNCVTGSAAGSGTGANYYGGPGTGDIQTDPLLSSGTFKVSVGSPTLGAADGSTRIGNVDREGTFVTWQIDDFSVIGVSAAATPNDMGSFEFKPTSVCGVKTENISKVLGTAV